MRVMSKALMFFLGLVVGIGMTVLLGNYLGLINPTRSATEQALAARIESIPIENICAEIGSGKLIAGDDHVSVWSDHKRYIVVGWQVGKSGMPVFYWTGADLPNDIPGCKGH